MKERLLQSFAIFTILPYNEMEYAHLFYEVKQCQNTRIS